MKLKALDPKHDLVWCVYYADDSYLWGVDGVTYPDIDRKSLYNSGGSFCIYNPNNFVDLVFRVKLPRHTQLLWRKRRTITIGHDPITVYLLGWHGMMQNNGKVEHMTQLYYLHPDGTITQNNKLDLKLKPYEQL